MLIAAPACHFWPLHKLEGKRMARIESFGLDVGTYGPLANSDSIMRLVQKAETTGFESVWLADHIAFPVKFNAEYPYSATGDFPTRLADPLMEPVALMAIIAGATKRVRIGTAVLIMPYRNPVVLSRMLATIDNFSNGRVILGAGVGWLEEEFQVLDAPDFKKRGKVTDEYIEIFKAISAGGEVGYRGETYSFEPIFSAPGSVQRPHPPVLIGGVADAALRRVARHGNGWLAVAVSPDKAKERLSVLKRMTEEQGRRYADLDLTFKIFLNIGEAKRSKFDAREPGTGSMTEIIDDLKKLSDLGFKRFVVRYRGGDPKVLDSQIDRFIEEIVPKV